MSVKGIKEEIASDRNSYSTYISIYDAKKAVKVLKKKKACWHDCICNDHLINGVDVLYEQLTKFYTDMYNNSYIPPSLKQGIIITHYRAITLSSVLLKLFEFFFIRNGRSQYFKAIKWFTRWLLGKYWL